MYPELIPMEHVRQIWQLAPRMEKCYLEVHKGHKDIKLPDHEPYEPLFHTFLTTAWPLLKTLKIDCLLSLSERLTIDETVFAGGSNTLIDLKIRGLNMDVQVLPKFPNLRHLALDYLYLNNDTGHKQFREMLSHTYYLETLDLHFMESNFIT